MSCVEGHARSPPVWSRGGVSLHRHPELGFEERRTAGFVVERLRELGVEVREGVGETGVLGLLRAERSDGPAVMLRADMDALPIQEAAGREYGSTVDGKMHACGHDGHMAMMLGAVDAARRPTGTSCAVTWCSASSPPRRAMGGAERMIADGVLEWVEVGSAFALHLWSQFSESGTIQVRPGPTMAAQDEFTAPDHRPGRARRACRTPPSTRSSPRPSSWSRCNRSSRGRSTRSSRPW